jgi:hypothetical protein
LSEHGVRVINLQRFGAYYAYNASTSTFEFYKGEELRQHDRKPADRKPADRRPVEYPQMVHLVEDTHPEIFAANGSHGFWATAGTIDTLDFESCRLRLGVVGFLMTYRIVS